MLGLVVAIFMICWAPYQLYHLFLERLLNDFIIASYTYMVFYWMAMSACVYNPIIYCYFNVRFRIGFRYAFRWLPFFNFQLNEREYSQLFPDAARMITSSTALKTDISKNRLYSQRNTLVGSKSSNSILLTDFTQRDLTTSQKP
uniref:G-protein coupled receptors family 1 profile domain-containing protein n=1 Tax=Panagrolaimus superbus TaxID=310955 RepID=A0A914YA50_9BILA